MNLGPIYICRWHIWRMLWKSGNYFGVFRNPPGYSGRKRWGFCLLGFESLVDRDYPVVMGTVLIMTAIYVSITIAADLLIARLDPRVRDVFRG